MAADVAVWGSSTAGDKSLSVGVSERSGTLGGLSSFCSSCCCLRSSSSLFRFGAFFPFFGEGGWRGRGSNISLWALLVRIATIRLVVRVIKEVDYAYTSF